MNQQVIQGLEAVGSASEGGPSGGSSGSDVRSVEERVNSALDKVRPGIQADGGEVWLIKVEDGVAYVQMLGACGGCPASTMTLKGAIEAVVTADVPEVREVLQI